MSQNIFLEKCQIYAGIFEEKYAKFCQKMSIQLYEIVEKVRKVAKSGINQL